MLGCSVVTSSRLEPDDEKAHKTPIIDNINNICIKQGSGFVKCMSHYGMLICKDGSLTFFEKSRLVRSDELGNTWYGHFRLGGFGVPCVS